MMGQRRIQRETSDKAVDCIRRWRGGVESKRQRPTWRWSGCQVTDVAGSHIATDSARVWSRWCRSQSLDRGPLTVAVDARNQLHKGMH